MNLKGKTIAITGASGFVGHYAARVALQRGANVIAILRNPDTGLHFSHPKLEIREGDITNLASLERAMAGADALIASAALISIGFKDKEDLIRTNEVGTKNTFVTAAATGIKRAVLVSSVNAYKPKKGHHYLEDDPLRTWSKLATPPTYYGNTKAESERIATRIARRYEIDLSIVRPQMIYGAYCRDGFSKWLDWFCEKNWPADISGWRFPTVYAGDLAEAIMRMLERDVAVGQTYNVANTPAAHTFGDHVAAWHAARGQTPPKPVLCVPAPVVRRYNIDKVMRDLDWENRDLLDGYRETLALQQGATP